MDSQVEEPPRAKIYSLRLAFEKNIQTQQQSMDALTASFRESLFLIRSKATETVNYQKKLLEVKSKLREAEDVLVKTLSVKTRKEAKRLALMDSIAARRARLEQLKRTVQEQRTKRDEYASILSQQSLELGEKDGQSSLDEVQEAISWYNRVLGFHIEGGHGVKFTFKNINHKNPNKEFSFTIRHADDTYTLLDCGLHFNDIKELIHELNRTNGLFKFVRIMRRKILETAAEAQMIPGKTKPAIYGVVPQSMNLQQDSSTVSISAPVLSISSDRSLSQANKNKHPLELGEVDQGPMKLSSGKGRKNRSLTPESALSPRRSLRHKA